MLDRSLSHRKASRVGTPRQLGHSSGMTDPILPSTQPEPQGDGPVVSDVRAKSGRGGMHVMVILVTALLLVAIGFALLYVLFAPNMQAAENRTEAATTSAPAAQPLPERPATAIPGDDAAGPARQPTTQIVTNAEGERVVPRGEPQPSAAPDTR